MISSTGTSICVQALKLFALETKSWVHMSMSFSCVMRRSASDQILILRFHGIAFTIFVEASAAGVKLLDGWTTLEKSA